MGFRETVQRHRSIAVVLAMLATAIAVYVSVRTVVGPPRDKLATRAFYTTDDGKTWFVDDVNKAPPFATADGKEAVGAVIVSCRGGKDPFALYLWRYTEAGKKDVEQNRTGPDTMMKREVKRPGETAWIKTSDMLRASKVQQIACPPGQDDYVEVQP